MNKSRAILVLILIIAIGCARTSKTSVKETGPVEVIPTAEIKEEESVFEEWSTFEDKSTLEGTIEDAGAVQETVPEITIFDTIYNETPVSDRDVREIAYEQFKGEFVPNLSIIDMLMFNAKDQAKKLLEKFELN